MFIHTREVVYVTRNSLQSKVRLKKQNSRETV